MEKRNVQLTGQKSFTITLPKQWIRFHNIQPKQPLYIKYEKNGSLIIHPQDITENMEKVVVMKVENQADPELLLRSILGQYTAGKNILKILGQGKF